MNAALLGQDHAVRAMVRALRRGRLHHAWILHGPLGVGKFTASMRLARLLLDPATTGDHIERFEPPRDTEVARLIDAGTHPDLHVIRKELAAESEMRELRERKQTNLPLDLLRERMLGGGAASANTPPVFRTPLLGHGKVFIIDEAELLEVEAQNAMLKTLEEPPERTWIILCTQQEDRLLPTIRSRCQRIAFGTLPPDAMARWWSQSNLAPSASERAWVDGFACGSPGMAKLAVDAGLPAAWESLRPGVEALAKGGYSATLAEAMAEFVDDHAKSIVKANEQASKEAANRAGARALLAMLGAFAQSRLREAVKDQNPDRAERWLEAIDRLHGVDAELRANLNMKHVLAHLVSEWSRRLHPAGAR
ncbi:MAG: hypothetical protein KF724_00685 [Phycisphaeraceae bacterium]|nr:hypothetical protein [Phycisphaeraceae bacterium]